VVRDMGEAQLVCEYIEAEAIASRSWRSSRARRRRGSIPTCTSAASACANQTTMLARESLADR
jgi:hypothetical protein